MNHSLIFFQETDYIYSFFTDKLKKQTYFIRETQLSAIFIFSNAHTSIP
jgi:hypothetical protein